MTPQRYIVEAVPPSELKNGDRLIGSMMEDSLWIVIDVDSKPFPLIQHDSGYISPLMEGRLATGELLTHHEWLLKHATTVWRIMPNEGYVR